MKQINRIFVVFFILTAFNTLQAQDITDLTVDPFNGANGYAGSTSLSGIGDYDLSVTSPEYIPAPQSGLRNSAFRQEGIASWYGTEFEGHPTASGEIFNPAQLTAAHPNLPFGTMLKVTNIQNNRQVTVRVNDRGPFVNTRIIDVSRAAAEVLDILGTGTAPVVVELAGDAAVAAPQAPPILPEPWIAPIPVPQFPAAVVPPAVVEPPAVVVPPTAIDPNAAVVKPGIPPYGTDKRYRIQVGAYKVTRNAVDTFDRVKSLGIEPSYERHDDFYRVVIGGIRAEDIQTLAGRLGSAGFREILVREE
ncbi:septal ring lytic transglycosylase RlpA family protein [Treponema primitia]|uniref:septal ring lytic transglycosylase RlpA family protein n=1 Tax=Treponema primitia TaxID=88058 RepID=UPI0039801030